MLALQTDIYSEFDRFCAQRFVYAVDHARNPSPRARQAAGLGRREQQRERERHADQQAGPGNGLSGDFRQHGYLRGNVYAVKTG